MQAARPGPTSSLARPAMRARPRRPDVRSMSLSSSPRPGPMHGRRGDTGRPAARIRPAARPDVGPVSRPPGRAGALSYFSDRQHPAGPARPRGHARLTAAPAHGHSPRGPGGVVRRHRPRAATGAPVFGVFVFARPARISVSRHPAGPGRGRINSRSARPVLAQRQAIEIGRPVRPRKRARPRHGHCRRIARQSRRPRPPAFVLSNWPPRAPRRASTKTATAKTLAKRRPRRAPMQAAFVRARARLTAPAPARRPGMAASRRRPV